MVSSKYEQMQDCAARLTGSDVKPGGKSKTKLSVSQRFKGQLQTLVKRLNDTSPHFVRCIKPNAQLAPSSFDPKLILQQLRCCGVLEVRQFAGDERVALLCFVGRVRVNAEPGCDPAGLLATDPRVRGLTRL